MRIRRSRMSREFYRATRKVAETLRDARRKRAAGSATAVHFTRLSALCGELLTEYGPERRPRSGSPRRWSRCR